MRPESSSDIQKKTGKINFNEVCSFPDWGKWVWFGAYGLRGQVNGISI
jgi:hypothetical protein